MIFRYPDVAHENLQESEREKRQEQQFLVPRRPHRPDDGQRQQEDEKVSAQLNAKDGKVRLYAVTVRGLYIHVPVRAQGDTSCENKAHARDACENDHGHEHSKRLLDPIIGQGPHVQQQDGNLGRHHGQCEP